MRMDVEYDKATPAIELSRVYNKITDNSIKIVETRSNNKYSNIVWTRLNTLKWTSPTIKPLPRSHPLCCITPKDILTKKMTSPDPEEKKTHHGI